MKKLIAALVVVGMLMGGIGGYVAHHNAYAAGYQASQNEVERQCKGPKPLRLNGHTYRCEFRY